MAELDPENIRQLAHQFAEKMGATTLDEAIAKLEKAIAHADGPKASETFKAYLTVIQAAKEIEEG